MKEERAVTADRLRLIPDGGEMGARIRALEWAGSPAGPVETWPVPLLNAVRMILPAHAEIVLFWGDDYLAFYNDAYAPTIGTKHPAALGRPARDSWSELWDDLAPLLDHVRTTGETYSAKDRPFYLERSGAGETAYFDISYSAISLDDGSVGGVMCIVSETSERVRAARTISADRERLTQMFEQAPGFMAVLRQPGHVFELANAAYRALVGGRELIGRPLGEALSGVLRQGFLDLLDEVVRTRTPHRETNRPVWLPRPDGRLEERVVEFVCQPLVDASGTVTSIFVEGSDVTERERARRELALSEEALELAAIAAEIGTWDLDLATQRLNWSGITRVHFGVTSETPVTLDLFFSKIHPDDRAAVRQAFAAALDPTRRALYDVEYRVGESGRVRWIAAKGRAIFDDLGRCIRAIGTTMDITERKHEGEALRESEARFRALADALPALIWITDARGAVTFANSGFEHILKVSPSRVERDGWASLVRAEDRQFIRMRNAARLASPQVFGGEFPVVGGDGEEHWIHGEVRPRYVDGRFIGYVACAIDVTEAHLAGEALEQRIVERTAELTRQISERERVEETLHQMQRLEAVGQLTSGVAHDFNNLLTVVLGNVDMLTRAAARGALDARGQQRLDHIRTAAQRGATLTAQLLAFSRRQRLEAKAVDLNETVAGMTDLLQSTLGRAITVRTSLVADLWAALVDPTQIELIILNLAINSRDAMPEGGTLIVSTANVIRGAPERAEEPAPGDYVAVSVSDGGTGMTEAVLARAFEPFFTTKEVGKGSGLGLAQVFGFAKQSGGGVRIDTVEGEGTTVSVFLPRAGVSDAASTMSLAHEVGVRGIAGRTIMVLDDEDAVRDVTVEALREAGARVVEARAGEEALAALAENPDVEAVVADFAMPVMNGVEFARRAHRRWPHLPILFVTGYADLAAIADVPEERIIGKPFTAAGIIERVAQALDRA